MLKKSLYKRLLVTGGAGFIGSAFIKHALVSEDVELIVNLDALTYAADLTRLKEVETDPHYLFAPGDICSESLIEGLLRTHQIDAIVHFAAESHVDRSIEDPNLFTRTNILGTLSLLEVVRRFEGVHFHHVSTDEVFGSVSLGETTEKSLYAPNSPYAASKASADHMTRAYFSTYGISVTLSHGSNTYGPHQHPEKFLPLMLQHCLQGKPLPVYGKGINVRDWLFVDDHAEAIWHVLCSGRAGESYNVSGGQRLSNLELLEQLFAILSRHTGESVEHYRSLITFVEDRLGHDLRYALCCDKIESELKWKPRISLEAGLDAMVSLHVPTGSFR